MKKYEKSKKLGESCVCPVYRDPKVLQDTIKFKKKKVIIKDGSGGNSENTTKTLS